MRFSLFFIFSVLLSVPSLAASIHIVGSTTILPIMAHAAKAYQAQHPDLNITVSGGGSGVGAAALIQETADIGMMSRQIDPKEQVQLDDDVIIRPIAMDAVAVVVSKAVYLAGVHALSLQQIAAIYRGETRNWKDLGGPDARILVIDKEASRGTRHVFAKAVLGSSHARAAGASLISGSNNEEQALVAHSQQAIGMLSNAWLNDDVRGIAVIVDGKTTTPSLQHIRDGSYPISRRLNILYHRHSSQELLDFVRFIISKQGQDIVRQQGYVGLQ